jgi:hypothetical protein
MLIAGCAQEATSGDVTGPFTGTPRRYVIDSFSIPTNTAQARALGDDLNGDKTVDNQLGQVIGFLGSYGNQTTHAPDMIASGAIASTFLIRANDYWDDATVSVVYYGSDGDPATKVGGRFEDSVFASNRTAATAVPGSAVARVPIFVDSDPSVLPLVGLQMTLVPDGRGFDATISGAIDPAEALSRTYDGLVHLIAAEPDSHRSLMQLFDLNRDWSVSYEEIAQSSLLESLLAPDVSIGELEALSFGFHVHITPCGLGTCTDEPPADTCHDRIQDGDESDIDCGGACRSCKSGERCAGAADCESNACDAGACRAPSCTDGVRDGFETDVDCGGSCGATCALAARCFNGGDCASGQCGEPCTNPDPLGCIDLTPDFDTCRPAPPS